MLRNGRATIIERYSVGRKSERGRRQGDIYEYGAGFYRANTSIATRSAQRIAPSLAAQLSIRSVADFGCGEGAWLSVWRDLGALIVGADGADLDRRRLMIDPACFHTVNLAQPISLGRSFDLAQSLEVAEHLPAASAGQFVETLTAHSPNVLFSAAIPGQGGEHHINEQPLEYWRALFCKQGYSAFDYLRPLIVADTTIEWWYRYNIMLYVRNDGIGGLPEPLRLCRVPDGQPLREYRPLPFRIQNALVRRLPASAVDSASRMKWRLAARLRRA